MARRLLRLQQELKRLKSSPPPGVLFWPETQNFTRFIGVVTGPDNTPYEGGVFKLEIEIPENYPIDPPRVRFETKVYHPNIDSAGRICLSILQTSNWRAVHNLSTILTSVRQLLSEPNPQHPLMTEIAEEYQNRRPQYDKTAREWTNRHATSMGDVGGGEDEPANKRVREENKSMERPSDTSERRDTVQEDSENKEGEPAKKRMREESNLPIALMPHYL